MFNNSIISRKIVTNIQQLNEGDMFVVDFCFGLSLSHCRWKVSLWGFFYSTFLFFKMKSGNWIFNMKIYLVSIFNWDSNNLRRVSYSVVSDIWGYSLSWWKEKSEDDKLIDNNFLWKLYVSPVKKDSVEKRIITCLGRGRVATN